MKNNQIPKSKAKIDHYIDSSQQKLTKLVMGYVDKYAKGFLVFCEVCICQKKNILSPFATEIIERSFSRTGAEAFSRAHSQQTSRMLMLSVLRVESFSRIGLLWTVRLMTLLNYKN
ncbi:hypothetical protein OIU77_031173 [Salix suchowensis]|uniref:Uncharacterized protein n=1 Tax=Salix suchowensis TaxID=1278906 RepID=A0ABQ9BEX2_9ROSI|nr:hypothetical protein OIU77_031173 [Salix suchowensis]